MNHTAICAICMGQFAFNLVVRLLEQCLYLGRFETNNARVPGSHAHRITRSISTVLNQTHKYRSHQVSNSLTLSLSHSLSHSVTHSLTFSLTHSLTHARTHARTHSLTHHSHSLPSPPLCRPHYANQISLEKTTWAFLLAFLRNWKWPAP